jgi:hypothetical protein
VQYGERWRKKGHALSRGRPFRAEAKEDDLSLVSRVQYGRPTTISLHKSTFSKDFEQKIDELAINLSTTSKAYVNVSSFH